MQSLGMPSFPFLVQYSTLPFISVDKNHGTTWLQAWIIWYGALPHVTVACRILKVISVILMTPTPWVGASSLTGLGYQYTGHSPVRTDMASTPAGSAFLPMDSSSGAALLALLLLLFIQQIVGYLVRIIFSLNLIIIVMLLRMSQFYNLVVSYYHIISQIYS